MILRRRSDEASGSGATVVVGDVEVDLARQEARRRGHPVTLAPVRRTGYRLD